MDQILERSLNSIDRGIQVVSAINVNDNLVQKVEEKVVFGFGSKLTEKN